MYKTAFQHSLFLSYLSKMASSSEEFTFFWKKDSPFSQWYSSKFKVDGITYNSAEQFMMHQKAVLFGDTSIADQVMKTTDPRKQKSLGRKVSNFDAEAWNKQCREIVKRGNKAKFGQNADIRKVLLDTSGTILVEASPMDTIWGIGLEASDPQARNRETWNGTNWLGFALTDVREEILKEQAQE